MTSSYTYTESDIEAVLRLFTADIVMIAQSSGALTESKARHYAHDVEALAKKGYLAWVDLTLFSNGAEVEATRYTVNTSGNDLVSSRPGGVMWPRVSNPFFQIILSYTSAYDSSAREAMRPHLLIPWGPTSADTNHSSLKASGGRDYSSNGWSLQRQNYSK